MYTIQTLLSHAKQTQTETKKGHWVPARPLRLSGRAGLCSRLRDAWAVLTDKADAIRWPEGQ